MKQTLRPALLLLLLTFCLPVAASASNSWVWTSETRPVDLFPVFFLGVLALEEAIVLLWARPQKIGLAAGVLFLGNIETFLLPAVIRALSGTYDISSPEDYYLVGLLFLAATLLIEIPWTYQMIKKASPKPKTLLPALLVANTASTAALALIERLLAPGYWV